MAGISGEALMAVEWSLVGVALVLAIARLYLRLNHLKLGLVLSDWFILGALTAAICVSSTDITLYLRGVYDAHADFTLTQWVAPPEERVAAYKTFFALYFPFYVQQYFNKGTLIALYFEIFGQRSSKVRIALWSLTAYCAIGFITTICVLLFNCRWGCWWSLTDRCPTIYWEVVDNLGWAFHFTADVLIFILPLVCVSRLQLTRAQKISASITFCIGFINISITLARWFVVQAVFTPSPALTTGVALAVSDGHTSLIVAILPSLRPYLRLWRRSDRSTHGTDASDVHTPRAGQDKSSYEEFSQRSSQPSV